MEWSGFASSLTSRLRTAESSASSPCPVFAEMRCTSTPLDCRFGAGSGFTGRSHLFHTKSARSPTSRSRAVSSGPRGSAPSCTSKTRSARSIISRPRTSPICSTASVLSRSPAVSTSLTGKPSRSTDSSRKSRVVPGISVTIARSRPRTALRRLDLPALTRPEMTTSAPSRHTRARS